MSQQLDRTIRAYVARGSGLAANLVRPGNEKSQRPKVPYATVLTMRDIRTSAPMYRQMNNATTGLAAGTLTETPRRRTYSVQFYREGALDLANRFEAYTADERGLQTASVAFGTYGGRVRRLHVLDGGAYSAPPLVNIEGPGGAGATAEVTLAPGTAGSRSPIAGVGLMNPGRDYVDGVTVTLASGDPGDTPADVRAVGWGFVVVQPLEVRRLDEILGDAFEERAQIDLPILYTTIDAPYTGGVDAVECEVIDGGSGEALVRAI